MSSTSQRRASRIDAAWTCHYRRDWLWRRGHHLRWSRYADPCANAPAWPAWVSGFHATPIVRPLDRARLRNRPKETA